MVQPITTSEARISTPAQTSTSKATGRPISDYPTTLSSAKQGKLREYFLKSWHFVRDAFTQCLETVLYYASCGMSATNRMEIVEEIIENPEEMAKQFAKQPKEMMGELIAACLADPRAVQDLRNKNKDKVGTFIRAFKEALPADQQSFATGIVANDKTYLHKQFLEFFAKKGSLILTALKTIQPKVIAILGEQKTDEAEEVAALRGLFVGYLPKLLAFGKKNPIKFEKILEELIKVFTAQGTFNPKVLSNTPELNDSKGVKDLLSCLKEDQYCLNVLSNPRLIGLPEAPKINVNKEFCIAFLRQLTSSDFTSAQKFVTPEYTLVSVVLDELKGIVKSRSERTKMADNYPEAWALINQLDQDFVNPPAQKN